MAEKQRAKGDGGEREEGAATSAEIATRDSHQTFRQR